MRTVTRGQIPCWHVMIDRPQWAVKKSRSINLIKSLGPSNSKWNSWVKSIKMVLV